MSSLLAQAQAGDERAIAAILNSVFKDDVIKMDVSKSGTCLRVVVLIDESGDRRWILPRLHRILRKLDLESLQVVRVIAIRPGASDPLWKHQLSLEPSHTGNGTSAINAKKISLQQSEAAPNPNQPALSSTVAVSESKSNPDKPVPKLFKPRYTSFFKALFLTLIGFPLTFISVIGVSSLIIGYFITWVDGGLAIALVFVLVGLFLISFCSLFLALFYHAFWFYWRQPKPRKHALLKPNRLSVTEGYKGTLIMGMTTFILLSLIPLLSLGICSDFINIDSNINTDIYFCTGELSGRFLAAKIVGFYQLFEGSGTLTYSSRGYVVRDHESLIYYWSFWSLIWFLIATYIYHVQDLWLNRFKPQLKALVDHQKMAQPLTSIATHTSKALPVIVVLLSCGLLGLSGSLLFAHRDALQATFFNPEPTTDSEIEVSSIMPSYPFRDAVNQAIKASNLTQTAQTAEEWQEVVDGWNAAITGMENVPESHEQSDLARQKALEYRQNLNYAQEQLAVQ
ncbi:hypothetical protein [Sodalinema gerasimenkoae]|uniref:hypothetical protein n=1 Tax=Sodalinema gerasimenkoae TaxID=2862348 RepID=UPI00135AA819|nr:hypothetical protein [Sodalinema gerasimenkoae]